MVILFMMEPVPPLLVSPVENAILFCEFIFVSPFEKPMPKAPTRPSVRFKRSVVALLELTGTEVVEDTVRSPPRVVVAIPTPQVNVETSAP
jgi:hypothetical protein